MDYCLLIVNWEIGIELAEKLLVLLAILLGVSHLMALHRRLRPLTIIIQVSNLLSLLGSVIR